MAIIYVIVVFWAWYLFSRGKRVYALLIFFFFVIPGFQLVPEETMELMKGFSKGPDFAVVLLVGCLAFDFFRTKNYFKIDTFVKFLLAFYVFLFACAIYSKYTVGCSWYEIIRTARYFLLFMVYFVFRNTSKDELEKLFRILFYITLFLSCLYLLQIVFSQNLLNKTEVSVVEFGDLKIKRFYNQPLLLYLMALMAIYKNPLKGYARLASILILVLAVIGGFSRSAISLLFAMVILGYILTLPKIVRFKIAIVSISIFIPIIAIGGHYFMKSRTFYDIKLVLSGNFIDIDNVGEFADSSFAFRMGHLFERAIYINETPQKALMGIGLFPEDSPKTGDLNFFIGLVNEQGNLAQIDSADITYSGLILRFGYIGTALFMFIYFYMIYFFYRKREDRYAFIAFLFLVFSMVISFFSSNLTLPVTYLILLLMMNLANKGIEEKKKLDAAPPISS